MTEFKVGDRVRAVMDFYPYFTAGREYTVSDFSDAGNLIFYRTDAGRPNAGAWSRNFVLVTDTREAGVANAVSDELAELRAFKETALASGYVPPEPFDNEDFEAAKRFTLEADWFTGAECVTPYEDDWEGSVASVAYNAIAWARANPR